MNVVEEFVQHVDQHPRKTAVWISEKDQVTFQQVYQQGARIQSLCLNMGLKAGDRVLLVDTLSTRLYGAISGLLASGLTVILVEPWMPVSKINHVIQLTTPDLLLSSWIGYGWGLRVKSVRRIPHKLNIAKIEKPGRGRLELTDVDPSLPGIITFTSGTTGNPKGVVRSQGYLVEQKRVHVKNYGGHHHTGADLCIFANFVLANLAEGRSTVLVPPSWSPRALRRLGRLPPLLQPETLTCGPAFLEKLMKHARVSTLKNIYLGGAQIDCQTFEKAFDHWPHARVFHIYGGSEVEPVSVTDGREAVTESRNRGYQQTLYFGRPVPEIRFKLSQQTLWVSGPHVCPLYVGNNKENQRFKKIDLAGNIWHCMGERVLIEYRNGEPVMWLAGRTNMAREDFLLEQKIYALLGTTHAFIHRDSAHRAVLLGEDLDDLKRLVYGAFPQIYSVITIKKIFRDKRHRSRIDRNISLKKGAPWLVG